MTRLWILFLLCLVPGCAQWNVAQGIVADRGAAVADEVLQSSEFTLCKAITVGAWQRAYGQSAERADAWRKLCSVSVTQSP